MVWQICQLQKDAELGTHARVWQTDGQVVAECNREFESLCTITLYEGVLMVCPYTLGCTNRNPLGSISPEEGAYTALSGRMDTHLPSSGFGNHVNSTWAQTCGQGFAAPRELVMGRES